MPLSEGVQASVRFKAYASGAISTNTEPDPATDPAATGGQILRRVTATLRPTKRNYESDEIVEHRQVDDFRLGPPRIEGGLTGRLSPATYWDFFEAWARGTDAATISKSEVEFTSVTADNGTSKFTVAASTWVAQGFRVGDVIRFVNLSDPDNNRDYSIVSLSGVDAFVYPAPDTMSADSSFTVSRPGRKVFVPTLLTDFVSRKFAFETYRGDIDVSTLFTECRLASIALTGPAGDLAGITLGVLGRGQRIYTGGSAPFFTAPAAATTTGLCSSVGGTLLYNGVSVGVVTSVNLTFDLGGEANEVWGQNFVPEIFLGKARARGDMSVFITDATFLQHYRDETEVTLFLKWQTTTSVTSPFFSIWLPRMKLIDLDPQLAGEFGQVARVNFHGLLKPAGTGFDNTTVCFQDSEAT